ncbi:MAG TPA: SH3 domain-containing protein, partial [Herpetosiphonaceae bacterium]
MQQSSPTRSTLIILALLLLTGCGTPRPSTEIAQLTPSPAARSTATSTPRRPTATARPAAPTAPPATTAALPPTTAPTSAPLPTPTAIAARAKAVVRNGGNVRRIPATGEPLDQVHAHEQVPLIGKNADASWYLLVTARGVTGWVSATLLTIEPAGIAQVPVVPETTQGQAASGPASDAWTTHTINESTIQLPSAWKVLPITDADLERAARELEGENAALAAMMRNILASGQATQMRFFAMDPATGTNVGMLAIPRPAGTPDELLSQVVDTLPKMAPMMKFISRDSKHHVNGWPAARVAYDLDMPLADGSTVTLRGVQWYVVGANQVF